MPIKVIEATTNVNGKRNTSFITGFHIMIGEIIGERNDGIFYENIVIENNEYRPFFRLENNTIELQCMTNDKKPSIVITDFI